MVILFFPLALMQRSDLLPNKRIGMLLLSGSKRISAYLYENLKLFLQPNGKYHIWSDRKQRQQQLLFLSIDSLISQISFDQLYLGPRLHISQNFILTLLIVAAPNYTAIVGNIFSIQVLFFSYDSIHFLRRVVFPTLTSPISTTKYLLIYFIMELTYLYSSFLLLNFSSLLFKQYFTLQIHYHTKERLPFKMFRCRYTQNTKQKYFQIMYIFPYFFFLFLLLLSMNGITKVLIQDSNQKLNKMALNRSYLNKRAHNDPIPHSLKQFQPPKLTKMSNVRVACKSNRSLNKQNNKPANSSTSINICLKNNSQNCHPFTNISYRHNQNRRIDADPINPFSKSQMPSLSYSSIRECNDLPSISDRHEYGLYGNKIQFSKTQRNLANKIFEQHNPKLFYHPNQVPKIKYDVFSSQNKSNSNAFQTQSVGQFNFVCPIQDLAKTKNLDYMEQLLAMSQHMHLSRKWHESQSANNKMKILQLYQFAIKYAVNTGHIYHGVLESQGKLVNSRENNHKKIEQIKRYKQKVELMKSKLRKKEAKKYKKCHENLKKWEKELQNLNWTIEMKKLKIQLQKYRQQDYHLYNQNISYNWAVNPNHSNRCHYQPRDVDLSVQVTPSYSMTQEIKYNMTTQLSDNQKNEQYPQFGADSNYEYNHQLMRVGNIRKKMTDSQEIQQGYRATDTDNKVLFTFVKKSPNYQLTPNPFTQNTSLTDQNQIYQRQNDVTHNVSINFTESIVQSKNSRNSEKINEQSQKQKKQKEENHNLQDNLQNSLKSQLDFDSILKIKLNAQSKNDFQSSKGKKKFLKRQISIGQNLKWQENRSENVQKQQILADSENQDNNPFQKKIQAKANDNDNPFVPKKELKISEINIFNSNQKSINEANKIVPKFGNGEKLSLLTTEQKIMNKKEQKSEKQMIIRINNAYSSQKKERKYAIGFDSENEIEQRKKQRKTTLKNKLQQGQDSEKSIPNKQKSGSIQEQSSIYIDIKSNNSVNNTENGKKFVDLQNGVFQLREKNNINIENTQNKYNSISKTVQEKEVSSIGSLQMVTGSSIQQSVTYTQYSESSNNFQLIQMPLESNIAKPSKDKNSTIQKKMRNNQKGLKQSNVSEFIEQNNNSGNKSQQLGFCDITSTFLNSIVIPDKNRNLHDETEKRLKKSKYFNQSCKIDEENESYQQGSSKAGQFPQIPKLKKCEQLELSGCIDFENMIEKQIKKVFHKKMQHNEEISSLQIAQLFAKKSRQLVKTKKMHNIDKMNNPDHEKESINTIKRSKLQRKRQKQQNYDIIQMQLSRNR